MNIDPMNPDQLSDRQVHIELLLAIGWTYENREPELITFVNGEWFPPSAPKDGTHAEWGTSVENLPPLDYNLIHEVEMMMLTSSPPVGSWDLYVETVTEKTKDPYRAFFLHIQSNPIKLARALLRALGESDER